MALRLMCITAHPDDECGGFGGALMLAHARGVRTSVICLTEGCAASHRGDAQSDEELGRIRRQEFAAALRVLEVDEGEVLHYPDGKLAQQNVAEVASELVERIRRFRPHVAVTFGGDGAVNLHPDHTMVSFFATAAFHWAGRISFAPEQAVQGLAPYRPQKLYYSSPPFLAYASEEEAQNIARVPASLVLELGELKARKYEAFLEHKTQASILSGVRGKFERYAGEERYLLAAARKMRSLPLETDMFEGLLEETGDEIADEQAGTA